MNPSGKKQIVVEESTTSVFDNKQQRLPKYNGELHSAHVYDHGVYGYVLSAVYSRELFGEMLIRAVIEIKLINQERLFVRIKQLMSETGTTSAVLHVG